MNRISFDRNIDVIKSFFRTIKYISIILPQALKINCFCIHK